MTKEAIQKTVQTIENYLDLSRTPVGVKFLYDEESFKAYPVPQKDRKVTYCNSVQLASRGEAMKLTAKNQACPNGAFALNFTDVPEPIANGMGRFKKGIYANQEISASINDEMKFLPERPYGVVVQPLKNYEEAPDVVIVVSTAYNIMRVIQGYGHHYGYPQHLKTVGLQAVCQDLTTYPYNTNDINISLLCPGTRLVANWEIGDIGIGIAWDKWEKTVDGVKKTTNPFARDNVKKEIIERLKEDGLDEEVAQVQLGQNYDDGSYTGGLVDVE